MTNILIGSDHGGFELKQSLINALSLKQSIHVEDIGTHSLNSVDYPDIATIVCNRL